MSILEKVVAVEPFEVVPGIESSSMQFDEHGRVVLDDPRILAAVTAAGVGEASPLDNRNCSCGLIVIEK